MSRNTIGNILFLAAVLFAWTSCSTQKNTAVTRWYHSTNSRYNIHFNGQVAYDEALKAKNEAYKDNMTEMLNVYPFDPASLEKKTEGGPFNKVIDKCVKAIKLHSIQKKPEKDPNKRNNTDYQKWFNQKEFNPFLKNSWVLMAKAEYQNDDYLKSISTFSYITRLFSNDPAIVAEARIWMVKAYGELGWVYEAEDILKKIELSGGVPNHLKGEYAAAYANLLIRAGKFLEAIPYLEEAVNKAENRQQSVRYKYLLGQVYEKTGNRTKAFLAYRGIGGLNTPYLYDLNSKLKQAENSDQRNRTKYMSLLENMAQQPKNKDYLDQIYFAQGNMFIREMDTLSAISSYVKAIAKSTRNGVEKTTVQVTLGDLYFERRQYVKAQPCYSEALGVLRKDHEGYTRVALRSQVLEQLAVHDQAIILQDSLQAMVRMPQADREALIDQVIADLIKKEKTDKLTAEREKAESNAAARPGMGGQVDIPVVANTQGGFYFDNQQAIVLGRNSFQKKWGVRKLEDNWRRRDKAVSVFAEQLVADNGSKTNADSVSSPDQLGENALAVTPSSDPHTRDYYLQQLPFSKQKLDESNHIIDDALFQMGAIYRDQLGDPHLSIDAYETELARFPGTPNKKEVYYMLYMLHYGIGNKQMAQRYRQKMIADFPQSDYAKSFADPDYEWNLQNPKALQDTLYNRTYAAYLKADVTSVRNGYEEIRKKYPQSDLMPKFIFLNALTYAQSRDEDQFKTGLREILSKYPQSDVTPVATEMLKQSVAGKTLAGSGLTKGMVWNTSFGKESLLAQEDNAVQFKLNDNSPQMLLLVYPLSKTNKNDLLYAVADYNFSHYVLSTFDLIFDDLATTGILQVKGFSHFRDLKQYVEDAYRNSLFRKLGDQIIPVPISAENYLVLQSGKTLSDYFAFFNESYSRYLPQIIALWKDQQLSEKVNLEAEARNSGADAIVGQDPQANTSNSMPVNTAGSLPTTSPAKDINIAAIKAPSSSSAAVASEPVVATSQNKDEDQVVETIENTVNSVKSIYKNPVDGLKGVLKGFGNKQKLTKEEKAEQKRLKAEEKAEKERLDKIRKMAEKAQADSIAVVRKSEQDALRQAQRRESDSIKAIENEKFALQKAKEDTRKAREEGLRQKERQRKEELKAKEKARQEKLRAREKELKDKERKQREKQLQREKEKRQKSQAGK